MRRRFRTTQPRKGRKILAPGVSPGCAAYRQVSPEGATFLSTLLVTCIVFVGCTKPTSDDSKKTAEPDTSAAANQVDTSKSVSLPAKEDLKSPKEPEQLAGGYDAAELQKRIDENMAKLSAEDRKLAEAQKFCPIAVEFDDDGKPVGGFLGTIDAPVKVVVEGRTLFVTCPNCKEAVKEDPKTYLKVLAKIEAAKKTSG